MKFISSTKWIKQGVAKKNPEKASLTKDELKKVLDESKSKLNKNNSDPEASTSKASLESVEVLKNKDTYEFEDDYDWENYDDDDDDVGGTAAGLAGLSVFSSNDEDPYMTAKDNKEDDSDIEDYCIRPDDNLIVSAQVEGDSGVLKFYVYNKKNDDLYVHHDVWVSSMPLCVEYLQVEDENLVAVGGMNPLIEVWDVDITEVVEPNFVLGCKKNKKKKISQKGHTDAVLDLAWNKNYRKVLASASADKTVAIWDINSGDVVTSLKHFSEKVQSISWHPYESQHLLTGTCSSDTQLLDCRDADNIVKTWKCESEVEKVIWNHFSPFYCFASTEKGFVHCYDVRTNKSVWSLSAHTKECTGLTLSSSCPNLLSTSSLDEEIKVWDIASEPSFIFTHKPKLGKIFCLESCPDYPFVICGGGDRKGSNLKVVDLMDHAAVKKHFESISLVIPQKTEKIGNKLEDNMPELKKRKLN